MPGKGSPKVSVKVPSNREYARLMAQTTIVYNTLLADKHDKLLYVILERKQVLDDQCDELALTDQDEALELAVKSQAELIELQEAANTELGYLHRDYQKKLTTMYQQLESQWRQGRLESSKPVDVKVYPHK